MEQDVVTLLLGVTLGLAIVGTILGVIVLASRASQSPTLSLQMPPQQTYNNEERWSVVKDANGRVKDIIVHREATTG
jgi:hypothetical protein